MVVDIASKVVTAKDTRAGALTFGFRKILDVPDVQKLGTIWIPELLEILWVLTVELRPIQNEKCWLQIAEMMTELTSIQNEKWEY